MRTALIGLLFAGVALAQSPAPVSTLYVYRANAKIKGVASHPSIYCDGIELTRLHTGTFFKTTIPPGKHVITMGRTEVGQFLDMESGKDYYFRFGHKNIFITSLTAREPFTLTQVSASEAAQEMDG